VSANANLTAFDGIVSGARVLLEAVPDDKIDWRPHEKSWTLGALASHIANLPLWTSTSLQDAELRIDADNPPPPQPRYDTKAALVEALDANAAAARAVIEETPAEEYGAPWTLVFNGEPQFTLPKGAVLRTFVLDHIIHHRAQLGVYLRLLDVPVPQTLGPTADFPTM